MMMTNADRLQIVRQLLAEWGVDGVIFNSPINRRWVSGFTGSAGDLLITADNAWLATDSRYWEQATQQASAFSVLKLGADREKDWQEGIAGSRATVIGFEANSTSVAAYAKLEKIEGKQWKALSQTVEPLRAIKSTAEVTLIRQAAAITDRAMTQVNELAQPGMSEKELAWELEKRMREDGADGMAFTIIVASGSHSALAHHRPSEKLLVEGDAIVIDMGALVAGYHSDLTRSFYLGSTPSDRFREIYDHVYRAQSAALAGIRVGITCKEADALARDVIVAAGYGDYFGHGLGHGVGLEIHEEPRLATIRDKERLHAGMVTTVEPGIYLPGWGGIRIEDLTLITETGVECLSRCPKNPIIPV